MNRLTTANPLKRLDDWDDFVASRYQENKPQEEFRNYDPDSNPGVAEFYRQNHSLQTFDFVQSKEREYLPLRKAQKTIWEAAEFLNTLVDESDPDTDLTQIDHLLQTSEAIRKDGHPRWMFQWVRKFNPYDLYSKGTAKPNLKKVLPYYQDLIAEFFPDRIDW